MRQGCSGDAPGMLQVTNLASAVCLKPPQAKKEVHITVVRGFKNMRAKHVGKASKVGLSRAAERSKVNQSKQSKAHNKSNQ